MNRKILESFGIPEPTPEFKFHPHRKWRFDYAWPDYKLAVEKEGGVFTKGRHTRPTGYLGDMEKYNAAAILGWRVLRYTPDQLNRIDTLTEIKAALEAIRSEQLC